MRFLGDVAYAVTFLQIDPLYAIDLSNPADPFIAGELEIPGVTEFLHPVTDELLLGLGRGPDRSGVKLELFDVSNLAQPLSRGSATIGGQGSWTEASYDRHAFTYLAETDGIDRFTIPVNVLSSDGDSQFLGSSLFLFEILDKNSPELAMLNSAGTFEPPSAGPNPDRVGRSRAFIHDDTVYYVRDDDVWAAFWHSPGVVNGPF